MGYNQQTPADADSTAWAILLLGAAQLPGCGGASARADLTATDADAQRTSLTRAGGFLARHQRRTRGPGGVSTYARSGPIRRFTGLPLWVPFRGWCRPTVEVTATAGRALRCLEALGLSPDWAGNTARRRADAAWRYVRDRQAGDGSWPAYWWCSPHLATEQAVALATQAGEAAPVRRAADWALRHCGEDGGWSLVWRAGTSSFATALSLSVLTTCRGPAAGHGRPDLQRAIARAVDALGPQQQNDGGWSSHPVLRIPVPPDTSGSGDAPRRHRLEFAGGIVVPDQHRLFTTATCVAALAQTLRD